MARSYFQKLKLLILYRILFIHSDESHPLTMAQMISLLNQYGISAERKSVYDDIETLRLYGADIISNRGKYYMASRLFELPELKLLVDVVQSSKVLSTRKSELLIKKIQSLCSVHEAKQLQRNVRTYHAKKGLNEEIYYTIDSIHTALQNEKKLSFQYYEWFLPETGPCIPQKHLRHNGKVYEVSPIELIWDRDHYYLVGCEKDDPQRKHFRIDKMVSTSVLEEPVLLEASGRAFDAPAYTKEVFGMFSGTHEYVTIQMPNRLIGVAVDRFGESVKPERVDADHFKITVHVQVSPQFYGWIFGLDGDVRVLAPAHVREQIAQRAKKWNLS